MPRRNIFSGYIIVAASFVIASTAWGSNRAFGVFVEPVLGEFGWTRAAISGAFTLNAVVMGFLAVVAGRLTDRMGPRLVLTACGGFLGLGYILVSRVNAAWQFYLFYGLIAGIGMCGVWAPLMSTVARWFVGRRALMSGILTAGPGVGIVIVPMMSSLLVSRYGWRISFLALGAAVLSLIVGAALFLRRDPREMNLLPYGEDNTRTQGTPPHGEGLTVQEATHTGHFWLLGLLGFCDMFLINVVAVHIVPYAQGLDIPDVAAAGILSVAAGVSIPGRILTGAAADRIGNRRALAICLGMAVAAFGLLVLAGQLWSLYVFAVLYGISLWATGGILSPLVAEFFGLRSHGTLFGCMVLASSLGGALGPIVVGYMFDQAGSYHSGFLLCLAVCGVSMAVILSLLHARTWRAPAR